jgi:hypothetical protein
MRCLPGACVSVALAAATVAAAPQDAALDAVLRQAAAYMAEYDRAVTAVVAHEDYVQTIPQEGRARQMKADLVMVADAQVGWMEFRDVFEVDGRAVRDRSDRAINLFLKPKADAFAQGRKIAEESARFNINPSRVSFNRTLNVPLTALRFLRGAGQPRSRWTLVRQDSVDGRTLQIVRFEELSKPRLIGSRTESAARGGFWLEEATGAVVRSELFFGDGAVSASIRVEFANHPTIKLWLPVAMNEHYTLRAAVSGTINGAAKYSNFRRFNVDTAVTIK